MSKKVAVVEDEAELASLIEYNLNRGGFQTRIFTGADGTFRDLETFQPDLIVLDVMLPGQDGFELCRRIRQGGKLARTPVIFLTARSDEVDRVLGLEIGGDDYITKPFSPREVVARVKSVVRRASLAAADEAPLVLGAVSLDSVTRRVTCGGSSVVLTATEFDLLEHLMRHPGRVYSREQLLSEVWGYAAMVGTRTVDVHVAQVRAKLGDDSPIRTVRGVGYSAEATG